MPQSSVKNLLHLVFSTMHRELWIPPTVRERLYPYQAGIFKEWDSPAIVIDGVEDHVHAPFAPKPFAWKFTRQDLTDWLKRASPHFLAASAA